MFCHVHKHMHMIVALDGSLSGCNWGPAPGRPPASPCVSRADGLHVAFGRAVYICALFGCAEQFRSRCQLRLACVGAIRCRDTVTRGSFRISAGPTYIYKSPALLFQCAPGHALLEPLEGRCQSLYMSRCQSLYMSRNTCQCTRVAAGATACSDVVQGWPLLSWHLSLKCGDSLVSTADEGCGRCQLLPVLRFAACT